MLSAGTREARGREGAAPPSPTPPRDTARAGAAPPTPPRDTARGAARRAGCIDLLLHVGANHVDQLFGARACFELASGSSTWNRAWSSTISATSPLRAPRAAAAVCNTSEQPYARVAMTRRTATSVAEPRRQRRPQQACCRSARRPEIIFGRRGVPGFRCGSSCRRSRRVRDVGTSRRGRGRERERSQPPVPARLPELPPCSFQWCVAAGCGLAASDVGAHERRPRRRVDAKPRRAGRPRATVGVSTAQGVVRPFLVGRRGGRAAPSFVTE